MVILIVVVVILAALWIKSRREAAIVTAEAEALGVSEEIQEAREKVRSPYLDAVDHVIASGVTHAKAVKGEVRNALEEVDRQRKIRTVAEMSPDDLAAALEVIQNKKSGEEAA